MSDHETVSEFQRRFRNFRHQVTSQRTPEQWASAIEREENKDAAGRILVDAVEDMHWRPALPPAFLARVSSAAEKGGGAAAIEAGAQWVIRERPDLLPLEEAEAEPGRIRAWPNCPGRFDCGSVSALLRECAWRDEPNTRAAAMLESMAQIAVRHGADGRPFLSVLGDPRPENVAGWEAVRVAAMELEIRVKAQPAAEEWYPPRDLEGVGDSWLREHSHDGPDFVRGMVRRRKAGGGESQKRYEYFLPDIKCEYPAARSTRKQK